MRRVTIPQEHKEGLISLISLSDDETTRLFDALKAERPALWPNVLAARAAEVSGLPADRIVPIINALISLIITRDSNQLSTEKVATDIAGAAAAAYLGGLGKPDSGQLSTEKVATDIAGTAAAAHVGGLGETDSAAVASFTQKLTRLLNLESLGVTSRAMNVLTQHQNPFRSARILSDIRAVFAPGEKDPVPVAALIVHNLQVVTSTGGGRYSTFIAALDTQDLRSLATVINRAIKKEEHLKSAIQKAGLSYIDVVPPED